MMRGSDSSFILRSNWRNITPWLFLPFHSTSLRTCFDFSFLNYILEENHNVSVSRTIFKKSSDEKISSYYPVISKFKMLLLRHLMDAHNIARLQGMPADRGIESIAVRVSPSWTYVIGTS